METTVILGLSINTRMLGLAVIMGTELLDYSIQLRKDPWTSRKREAILTSLDPWFERYSITSVALSTTYEKQTSHQTTQLLESIKRLCSEKKVRVSLYHTKTLVALCEGAKGKKEMMKALAFLYPELLFHLHKEMRNKNKYYGKLFEAVGAATLHSRKTG